MNIVRQYAEKTEESASKRRVVRIAAQAMAVAALVISLALVNRFIRWGAVPDLTMLWAGASLALDRPELTYDVTEVTSAQLHLREPPPGPLPFVYPPSSLPLLAPFALLPFWPAFWAWTAISVIAFWTAARRVASGWAIPLAFLSPPALLNLFLGQTAMVIGAAVIWAVSLLHSRPFIAGVLFGLAAAVKPQSVLLAPLALLAGRHRIAFYGTAAGWLAMVALSLPFGPGLWANWIEALGGFQQVLGGYNLHHAGATPAMAARSLGFPVIWPIQLVGIVAGGAIVWQGFRIRDTAIRVLALVCGTLLASPYAMAYDLTMLAPAAAAGLFLGSTRGLLIASPMLALNVFTAVPALLAAGIAGVRAPSFHCRTTC